MIAATTFDEALAAWATLGAAAGTVGAFGATWLVIRRDHLRRQEDHEDRLWDQALLVRGTVGAVIARDPNEPRGTRTRARAEV